jgi:non-ribosomal peptide synthetase component F
MILNQVEMSCIMKENRISGKVDSELIRDELLHELFEATADRCPDQTAVECNSRSLTYSELEKRANRLAHALRERGAAREDRIAIFLPRSENYYIAMLGVLKAGAAYIPLDVETPLERVRFILKDSGAKFLITMSGLTEALVDAPPRLLLDADLSEIDKCSSTRLSRGQIGASRHDLCYIIYTSGTTGRPKGVLIEHRNAAHLVRAESVHCRGRVFSRRRCDDRRSKSARRLGRIPQSPRGQTDFLRSGIRSSGRDQAWQ